MVDDRRGYGAMAGEFYRTNDGGRSWMRTKIPDITFIDHLIFLTPERGWISGIAGKDFFVLRTVNGGRDWEESRTASPEKPAWVRNLFFLHQLRGWLITWGDNDDGTYLYSSVDGGKHWTAEPDLSFQGKGKWASVVRFTSRERGFVFVDDRDNALRALMYTLDGGAHWHKQPLGLRDFAYDCQVFEGDLLCSADLRVPPLDTTSKMTQRKNRDRKMSGSALAGEGERGRPDVTLCSAVIPHRAASFSRRCWWRSASGLSGRLRIFMGAINDSPHSIPG